MIRRVRSIRGIDCYKDLFILCTPFKNKLVILDYHIPVRTVTKGGTGFADLNQCLKEISQLIWLWRIEEWAKCVIVVRRFLAWLAPFAAIVKAGNPRHAKEQTVGKRNVRFIGQNAGKAGDIMVVCECHQMLSTVNAPRICAELAVQRVGDFKEVHRVEAGI